ncbi:MAG TPA: PfkB family carbohydrate kinase [Candidatus Dormibacteraeota bacterium]|nr:PfkB family carbohydrate kinase [Candidatus Dormibacteraeota bacterium]
MLLAAIGDLVLDITIAPHGDLRTNDDTPASIRVGGGGQAANFCAWVASLGERSRLVTRVGDDDAGRRLVAELELDGVEVHAVRAAEPTGAIAVLIGPGGERTMATQRGASVGLRRDDLQPEWFAGVDMLHVPAYSLFAEPLATAARTAVEMVRLGQGRVSVDLSSVAGLIDYGPARMMSELSRIKPDVLFATAAESDAMPVALDSLAPVTAIKLGAAGCMVCGRRIASPAAEVVDPTGAGDAFAAAFCIAMVAGESPLRAGERAVRVAAAAVAKVGARPA